MKDETKYFTGPTPRQAMLIACLAMPLALFVAPPILWVFFVINIVLAILTDAFTRIDMFFAFLLWYVVEWIVMTIFFYFMSTRWIGRSTT